MTSRLDSFWIYVFSTEYNMGASLMNFMFFSGDRPFCISITYLLSCIFGK